MTTVYLELQIAPSEWPEWMDQSHARTDDGLGPMADFECSQCGKMHNQLWRIERRAVDVFGHFPVFRINGSEHVIDLTLPHTVDKIPPKAKAVGQTEAEALWHGRGHYFG